MRPSLLLISLPAWFVVIGPGLSLAATLPGPPDFGSEAPWLDDDISLVRVVSVNGGAVVLRTERSYTGQGDSADRTVPLSAISFGTHDDPGSGVVGPVSMPVSVKPGDELVVWRRRGWPPDYPFLPGTKVVGPAAKSALVDALEQISKIRDAGGRGEREYGRSTDELNRIAKLRLAGGEAALKRGARSDNQTVVCYALSVLENFRPERSDEKFAETLTSSRADAARPISVRMLANRLLPYYSAVPEQAAAEAAQWPRSIFAAGNGYSDQGRAALAGEIAAAFSKREDRLGYFLNIARDETKPRSVREAAVQALVLHCFDYEGPGSQAASDVFSAVLSLLKSKDGDFRAVASSAPGSICDRIRSKKDRDGRAKEAIHSLQAAIERENDERVRDVMNSDLWLLQQTLMRK